MTYIKEDKQNGVKEQYIVEWDTDIIEDNIVFEQIPGINAPKISGAISVE